MCYPFPLQVRREPTRALPGIPTRSRAFSLQRNGSHRPQEGSHDLAVYRGDNAYESPDEVESHATHLMNRVTLGPPDGDLYASIPDDIGLHHNVSMRGSAEKLSNDYTYPPGQDHTFSLELEQSSVFQRKTSIEVTETRPADRAEADVLGPLDGDSYSCVPGRAAIANFVSIIDTNELLSLRNPYESLAEDIPCHSLGNIVELPGRSGELLQNGARPEADVLGPLDGDAYTCISDRGGIPDSLPLIHGDETLSSGNYNTIPGDSTSYNSLNIIPDFTGKKNRVTSPQAAGTSEAFVLQVLGDDPYSTLSSVQPTHNSSSNVGTVEDLSNGNICWSNSGSSFLNPAGNASECYGEISKSNADKTIEGNDTNALGPLNGDVYASISNQGEVTSSLSVLDSNETMPCTSDENLIDENTLYHQIGNKSATMAITEINGLIPTQKEEDEDDADICADMSRLPSFQNILSIIDTETPDVALSENDDDDLCFIKDSAEKQTGEAEDRDYEMSSGCQPLSMEPLDCNLYGDISKPEPFSDSISLTTDIETLSGNVSSLYSVPDFAVSSTNVNPARMHIRERDELGSSKSGTEALSSGPVNLSSRQDMYASIPDYDANSLLITNARSNPSDNFSYESISDLDDTCRLGNSTEIRSMESETFETRPTSAADRLNSHAPASRMYESIPECDAAQFSDHKLMKSAMKNQLQDGYETVPDDIPHLTGNPKDDCLTGRNPPESRHMQSVEQSLFHSPGDDMYASIPD